MKEQIMELAEIIKKTGLPLSEAESEILADVLCMEGYEKKSEWISVENALPDAGRAVLIFMPRREEINLAIMRKGISKGEREKMRCGELPNPANICYKGDGSIYFIKRSELYDGADEGSANNTVSYKWEYPHGPNQWNGQEVSHWMPLPEPPEGE